MQAALTRLFSAYRIQMSELASLIRLNCLCGNKSIRIKHEIAPVTSIMA